MSHPSFFHSVADNPFLAGSSTAFVWRFRLWTRLVTASMYHITCVHPTWQLSINGIIFPQHRLMERADKKLCQRLFFISCLLLHHSQTDIMRFHLFKILHIGIANNTTKHQQQLRLPIRQGIALNMVAVVVKLQHELSVQPLQILLLLSAEDSAILDIVLLSFPYAFSFVNSRNWCSHSSSVLPFPSI